LAFEQAFVEDTIVAVSTPPGRGGIGVVRISGPAACAVAASLLRVRGEWLPGRARVAAVMDAAGTVLDEAVVTYFAAPRSYTGDDVVEIAGHGAPVLMEFLLRGAVAAGARLAEPGEFTRRAFLSGRMDLTQAEAVHDLVAAQTLEQARVAAAQLGGAVAQAVRPAKDLLVRLVAELEAGVDFAEDDIDLLAQAEIVLRLEGVAASLAALAATYTYGHVVREGFTLAIVGRANAGKSSLFNALLGHERAIVTAQAGTTRDPVAERMSFGGVPVELVDTAGLRELAATAENEAEVAGIERSRTRMAEADVVLHVIDATTLGAACELAAEDRALAQTLEGRNRIIVWNKADLKPGLSTTAAIQTSAKTGAGVDGLRAAIIGVLARGAPAADAAMITNLRQHGALMQALHAIETARAGVLQSVPHEMVLLDLYGAIRALDELTGATTQDEILTIIFSSFCIGK